MSTITQSRTELEEYCLLRFFHQSNKEREIYYCWDNADSWAKKRRWATTEKRALAYQFKNRKDAKQAAVKGACFDGLKEDGYVWEVIEVQEVRVTLQTFIEQTVASNASPLIQLARQSA